MKIIPLRTMRLDGQRVEQGKPDDVSDAAGDLAIRHGWATKVDKPAAKSAAKPAAKPDAEPAAD